VDSGMKRKYNKLELWFLGLKIESIVQAEPSITGPPKFDVE